VPTYVSLLRAINLAGHNRLKMSALEAALAGLDFEQVKTYLQSGNVIFHLAKPRANLCETIERRIHSVFGLSISVLSRTAEELDNIVQNNPFLKESGVDASKLHVTFLASAPTAAVEKLDRLRAEPDQYRYRGSEVYLYCPEGYGRTKLANLAIEKALAVRATTRNWRTVNQLHQMAAQIVR